MDLPDVARSVGHLTRISGQPRNYMCEAGADIEEDSDEQQFAVLLPVWQPPHGAVTQIESEGQVEQPRSEKPAEIVRQWNAKIGTAIMPYPSFRNCGFGPVHHQIPLCHHKGCNNRQRNDVHRSIESLVSTIEQDRGDNPREIACAEPQGSNDNWNASDVREVSADFKMVASKGEARRDAHILCGERD